MEEIEKKATEQSSAKLIVLRSGTMGRQTDAIIVSEAVWTPCFKGSEQRQVMVSGRMVDQEVAHNWFAGRDISRLESRRSERAVRDKWASFWSHHPERTYMVPSPQIAYTEVLEDESGRLGVSMAGKAVDDD